MKLFIYILLCIYSFYGVAEPLSVGDAAPKFLLPLLDTKDESSSTPNKANDAINISLADYKGKVIYVDFWASWCIPCRRSFPFLNKLRAQYADKGFEVLAINLEQDSKAAKQFLAEFPVSYPVLKGHNSDVGNTYQVRAMPTAYLIGKDGTIRIKHLGFNPAQTDYLDAIVDKLVSEF